MKWQGIAASYDEKGNVIGETTVDRRMRRNSREEWKNSRGTGRAT
jgi:hypothetical protein